MNSLYDFEAVGERLKEVLGVKTDAAVAGALGMSPQSYSARKKTASMPYGEIITALALRDFDLIYVLTGARRKENVAAPRHLSFARAISATEEPLTPEGTYPTRGQLDQEFVRIPLYDVRAAAGFGAFIHAEPVVEALAFRRDWIERQLGAQASDLILIYVAGDSMEPALSDGDVIMLDRSQNQVRRDGLYVLRMDDSLLVKKLQRLPGGLVKVSGENPAYESFTLEATALESGQDAALVGRVVWAARKF